MTQPRRRPPLLHELRPDPRMIDWLERNALNDATSELLRRRDFRDVRTRVARREYL
jgi:hypothetical protein